jgi:hypothetical protein
VKVADDEPGGAVIESHAPQASAEAHTSRVKACVALGAVPFAAVIVMLYAPEVPAAGVPERRPAELSVTPLGNAPVSVNVIGVVPVAVTVKLPAVLTAKVVDVVLVMVGAVAA